MKISITLMFFLFLLNWNKPEKEIFREYYDCWDYEICEFLKLYKDGTFNYKFRTMAGNYIDEGTWLIVNNKLTLKSNKKTRPFWKKRKKLFFNNDQLKLEGEKITFTNPRKKKRHSLTIKEKDKGVQAVAIKEIYKSYVMDDYLVIATLKLHKNGKFEYVERTNTNLYSMDFGNWSMYENNKKLFLKSNNIKFGIFKNSKFKIGNKMISNLKNKKYNGFFKNLNEE